MRRSTELYLSGMSISQVAAEIGRCKTVVRRYLRYDGVSARSGSAARRLWKQQETIHSSRDEGFTAKEQAIVRKRIARHVVTMASGCWYWETGSGRVGYVQMTVAGRHFPAHVASLLAHGGKIPAGRVVCHRCDEPRCVNPDHLFVGTQLENIQDAIAKGRIDQVGESNNFAKLTEENIREIRIAGGKAKYMAEKFGVHLWTIYKIRQGKRWTHVA